MQKVSEQRQLMGLSPRYRYRLSESSEGEVEDPDETPAEEDDWDMYKRVEDQARALAHENSQLLQQLSTMTENELSRPQRVALKTAQKAVKEAVAAQRNAFQRIRELGTTMVT